MDLGHRSESQVDYQDYEAENVFSESKLKEGVYGDPLAFGMNNNRLLDGFYQDVSGGAEDAGSSYDDNDVEIVSSLPPKNSRIGQKSKCPKCEEMVATSYMNRHIKQYHRPGGKYYKTAKSTRRQSKPIKCEFCWKGLAEGSLAKHIREVHQGKRCRKCDLAFSFRHSLGGHEMICSKK